MKCLNSITTNFWCESFDVLSHKEHWLTWVCWLPTLTKTNGHCSKKTVFGLTAIKVFLLVLQPLILSSCKTGFTVCLVYSSIMFIQFKDWSSIRLNPIPPEAKLVELFCLGIYNMSSCALSLYPIMLCLSWKLWSLRADTQQYHVSYCHVLFVNKSLGGRLQVANCLA